MPPSLQGRLRLLIAGVVVLSSLLSLVMVGMSTRRSFTRFVLEQDRLRARFIADIIRRSYEESGALPDLDAVLLPLPMPRRSMMGRRHAGPFPERVVVTDPAGRVLADSDRFRARDDGRRPRPDTPRPSSGETVVFEGTERVRVYVGSMLSSDLSPFQSAYVRGVAGAIVTAGLLSSIVAMVLGSALVRTIVAPLGRLNHAAAEIAAGRLDIRVGESGARELASLAASFNTMASSLRRTEEWRSRLLSDLAHELRTPLSLIRGNLEAMVDGVYPLSKEQIESVLTEARSLGGLVDQLQDVARLNDPGLKLELASIDVGLLAAQVCGSFAGAAAERGMRIETTETTLPMVQGDVARLAQVFRNVLSNFLSHCPEGSVLRVSAYQAKGAAELRFADNGPGIPESRLDLIFERLYRVEESRNRATGGHGLGLAIAKSIVEAHGGRIWAENAPNGGAVFIVRLPLPSEQT